MPTENTQTSRPSNEDPSRIVPFPRKQAAPPPALPILVALALAGVVALRFMTQRPSTAEAPTLAEATKRATESDDRNKKQNNRSPRRLALSVLIGLLENDKTRNVAIAGLKMLRDRL